MSAPSLFASFVGALRFFTRLRIPGTLGQDGVALERAIGFFPATGLLVGGVAALAFVASVLVVPKTLAVALAIAVGIVFTGAIHEDGWNDTVDGFGSSVDLGQLELRHRLNPQLGFVRTRAAVGRRIERFVGQRINAGGENNGNENGCPHDLSGCVLLGHAGTP
jgi:hypothetical protein